jgi:hypothetical protein
MWKKTVITILLNSKFSLSETTYNAEVTSKKIPSRNLQCLFQHFHYNLESCWTIKSENELTEQYVCQKGSCFKEKFTCR